VRLSTQKKITTTFVATALIALASCSTTIVGSTDTSAPAKVDVTTTLPVGTVKELLTNIIQATRGLGDAVASGDNKTAQSRLGDVLANWQVLKPMLKDSSLDIAADIERMIGLVTTAVERKRPADADKALRYLPLIVAALDALQ
jgi:hypothetical protein